jgi:hypothetical protein
LFFVSRKDTYKIFIKKKLELSFRLFIFGVNLILKTMEHNYVRSETFCMLTNRYEKKDGTFHVTGNTSEGLDVGDTINYIVNGRFDVLGVDVITERRDDKYFPKGNGLWYSCICGVVPHSDEELVKKLKEAEAKKAQQQKK